MISGLLALCLAATACATIAIRAAPEKTAISQRTSAALAADEMFWETFHAGRYQEIPLVLEKLKRAYLAEPRDALTAAHIAFLHIWRIAERARMSEVPATITDDMTLARRYFTEAVYLAPDDARFLGFLAATTMAEGDIHKDEQLRRSGFYQMADAVAAWPEFNLFTRGYVLSSLPFDNPRFSDGIADQWETLDRIAGTKVDRINPDFTPYLGRETHTGPQRVGWNSAIAPHNFEGFFLNMGDMLVKSGDAILARKIYAQAKLAKEYPTWPYREFLERRILDADANILLFRAKESPPERQILFQSPIACMACHQSSANGDSLSLDATSRPASSTGKDGVQ
jgi:hypothetical protein